MDDASLKNSFPPQPPSQQEIDAFVDAAEKGDILAVTAFLNRHPGAIDAQNSSNNGATALNKAAREGQKAVVELLLDKSAKVDARDKANWSPLITAASAGRTEVVALLLEKGAKMEATAQEGWTALMWAARFGRTDTVRFLLEKGADIAAINDRKKTVLELANMDRGENSETIALLEQWPEQQRLRAEAERKLKGQAEAETREKELNAERLEKLKNRRPPDSPFRKRKPGP